MAAAATALRGNTLRGGGVGGARVGKGPQIGSSGKEEAAAVAGVGATVAGVLIAGNC